MAVLSWGAWGEGERSTASRSHKKLVCCRSGIRYQCCRYENKNEVSCCCVGFGSRIDDRSRGRNQPENERRPLRGTGHAQRQNPDSPRIREGSIDGGQLCLPGGGNQALFEQAWPT